MVTTFTAHPAPPTGLHVDDAIAVVAINTMLSTAITVGSGQADAPITAGSLPPGASLRWATEDVRLGRLTIPIALSALLSQAVAARHAQANEDIDAWSRGLADEAAHTDP